MTPSTDGLLDLGGVSEKRWFAEQSLLGLLWRSMVVRLGKRLVVEAVLDGVFLVEATLEIHVGQIDSWCAGVQVSR